MVGHVANSGASSAAIAVPTNTSKHAIDIVNRQSIIPPGFRIEYRNNQRETAFAITALSHY
jgi:hypothetical protein